MSVFLNGQRRVHTPRNIQPNVSSLATPRGLSPAQRPANRVTLSSTVGFRRGIVVASVARYIDDPTPLPYHTALGALGRHVAESSPERYQPSNVTWALIEDVVGKVRKNEKRDLQVRRAMATIESIAVRSLQPA
jgi:hypothetical protein